MSRRTGAVNTISADGLADTLSEVLVAGNNVTISIDDPANRVTITSSGGTAGGTNITNLSASRTATDVTVISDTGLDAVLVAADELNAGVMTAADKIKINGIAAGAEVNVNPDWNAISGDAQILNKPNVSLVGHTHVVANVTDFATGVSNNTDVAANTANRHTHANKSVLDAVTNAFLSADRTKLDGIAAGAEVNVNADWASIGGDSQILNKPATFAPSAHTHPTSEITNLDTALAGKLSNADAPEVIADRIGQVLFAGSNIELVVNDLSDQVVIASVADGGGGTFNVRVRGATGDGVTDDTAAIQATIDAAKVKNGIVYFPPGVYIATTLTISAGITIHGDGATLRQKAATASHFVVVTAPGGTVRVSGLIIDGNGVNQAAGATNMLLRSTSTGTRANPLIFDIERNIFINAALDCVNIDGPDTFAGRVVARIRNNAFLGGVDGTDTYDPRYITIKDAVIVTIDKNYFDFGSTPTGAGRAGVVVDRVSGTATDMGRAVVTNNDFYNIGRDAPPLPNPAGILSSIDIYSFGQDILVSGNRMFDSKGRGITVKADCDSAIVTGNIIRNHKSAYGGRALSLIGSTTLSNFGKFIVQHNIVNGCDHSGLYVDGKNSDGTLKGPIFTVSHNQIYDTLRLASTTDTSAIRIDNLINFDIAHNIVDRVNGGAIATGSNGIFVSACAGSGTVETNRIMNVWGSGIHINSCPALHLDLRNNTVDTTSDVTSSVSHGIMINNLASGTVANNTMRSINDRGITIANTTGKIFVTGNLVDGSALDMHNGGNNAALWVTANAWSTAPTVVIAADAVTVWSDYHLVDTEAAAAIDILTTINGGMYVGQQVTLRTLSSTRDVTVDHSSTGNIRLHTATDTTLASVEDTITLVWTGAIWLEVGRGVALDGNLTASATLDFPSIPAQSCASLSMTITGAVAGRDVSLGPPVGLEAGLTATGIITAANTVTIRLCNVTAAAIDPVSAVWRATVGKR